jgi:Domain of unknown function (DUF6249)
LNPTGYGGASYFQRNNMKTSLIVCICSLALAAWAFGQNPSATATPATSPAATISVTVSPAATSSPPEDLADRIEARLEKKFNGHHGIVSINDHRTGESGDDIPDVVVPIVAITLLTVFGAPVLIVAVIMYFGFSKSRALHRTVRMMVEKGQPVPAALLSPPPAQRQRSDMRRGVVLLMIGVGLMVFFGAVNDWEGGAWSIGIIPFLIGAGYLLVWRLDAKHKDNPGDNPPPLP